MTLRSFPQCQRNEPLAAGQLVSLVNQKTLMEELREDVARDPEATAIANPRQTHDQASARGAQPLDRRST